MIKIVNFFKEKSLRFVYIGRADCSFCLDFVPILNKTLEDYNYDLHYLDFYSITDPESFTSLDPFLEESFGITPMFLIIKDKKLVDYQTELNLIKRLKAY